MFKDLMLLFQVGDFVLKACKAYAETPEGQKELADVAEAEAALSNGEPSGNSQFEAAVSGTLDAARAAIKASKRP